MAIDRGQKITLSVCLLIMLIVWIVSLLIRNEVKENAVYTVCYVYDYMSGVSSGSYISFYFYVDNKRIKGSNSYNPKYNVKVGEFYMVKYSSENPDFSEIQQDQRVFSTTKIKEAGLTIPKKKKNQFSN